MSRIFKALERAEAERRGEDIERVRPAEMLGIEAELDPLQERWHGERLKVMLTLRAGRSDLKTIMFISALPGEGVSTVTRELGVTMAEGAHQGVLVVELSPSPSGPAGRISRRWGLSDLLAKKVTRSDAVAPSGVPRLFFLERGRTVIDLSQAHWLGLFEELLEELRSVFDYLLVDGGSLKTAPDSLVVASRVDGVALVVQAERTSVAVARETEKNLRTAGANVLGAVLNRQRQYVPRFISRRL